MTLVIRNGNENYHVAKEVFTSDILYSFSTKRATNIDVFTRVHKNNKFNEKKFIEELIKSFSSPRLPSKTDLKPFAKQSGVIIQGLDYHPIHEILTKIIEKALQKNYTIEYRYDGIAIDGTNFRLEVAKYDPNTSKFTRIYYSINNRTAKISGLKLEENYDEILEKIYNEF